LYISFVAEDDGIVTTQLITVASPGPGARRTQNYMNFLKRFVAYKMT